MAANNKEQADFIKFLSTTLLPNEENAPTTSPEQQYPPNATGQRHQNGNETQNSNVNIQGQFQGYHPQQNNDMSYGNPTNPPGHQQNDMPPMYRLPNDGSMFQDPRYGDPAFMNVHDAYQHVSPQEEAKFVQNFAVGSAPPQFMGYNWSFQHPFGGLFPAPPQDSRLFNPPNGMGGMFTPQGAMPPYAGRQQDFGRPVFASYAPPMPAQDERTHQMYAAGVPGLQQMAPMPNMSMERPMGQQNAGQTQQPHISSQTPSMQPTNGATQRAGSAKPQQTKPAAPAETRDVQTKTQPKAKTEPQKSHTQQRGPPAKPEALHFGVANMSIQDNRQNVQKPPTRNTQTATRPANAKRSARPQQQKPTQPTAKPAARSWASIARKNPGKGPMHQPPRNPMPRQMPPKKKRPVASQTRDNSKRPGYYNNQNNTNTTPQSNGSYENTSLPKDLLKTVNSSSFDHRPKYARFFVIKSYSEDDVHKCIKYSIWASTDSGNRRLDTAFRESASKGPIYLFFSVNASGQFCGMAEMKSPVDYSKKCSLWTQDKWNGQFTVEWKFIKDIPNSQFRHIRLPNNDNKPVTNSRDTQEVLLDPGREILKTFKQYNSKTSILDDFAWYDRRQEFMIGKKKEQQNEINGQHSDYHYHKKNSSYVPSKGVGNHVKTNTANNRRMRKM